MRLTRRPLPSPEYLGECLRYSDDGSLWWKKRPRVHFKTLRGMRGTNSRYSGHRAGSPMANGYRLISIDNIKYLEHRLIYHLMVAQILDNETVDHVNLDFTDNRIGNLRACTHAENLMNLPPRARFSAATATLPKHVHWSKRERKFKVTIRAHGRAHFIGTFADLQAAASAAVEARARLHGTFGNDGAQP